MSDLTTLPAVMLGARINVLVDGEPKLRLGRLDFRYDAETGRVSATKGETLYAEGIAASAHGMNSKSWDIVTTEGARWFVVPSCGCGGG